MTLMVVPVGTATAVAGAVVRVSGVTPAVAAADTVMAVVPEVAPAVSTTVVGEKVTPVPVGVMVTVWPAGMAGARVMTVVVEPRGICVLVKLAESGVGPE